jgi:hypothetical protein
MTPESDIAIQLFVVLFAWFVMMWLVNRLVNFSFRRLKRIFSGMLEENKWIVTSANKLKNILMTIFGIWLFCFYSSEGAKEHDKFMAHCKSPRQQRLEFLQANCKHIDIEYKVLNNGKFTYKCPNGKEYII